MKLVLGAVQWDLMGIDKLMDQIILNAAGGIAGDIAGNQAEIEQIIDNQLLKMNEWLENNPEGTIARDIARGIARVVPEKMIQALSFAISPIERKEMLKEIGLVGNVKNFNTYIAPLVSMNWLTMTIPEKPTSPNQKYLTTLKGRILLNFLRSL